jgi:hypothetical protein
VPVDVRELDRGAGGRADHRRLRQRQLLPDDAGAPRPDGRVPPQGRARLVLRAAGLHRAFRRRALPSTFANWIEQLAAEQITGGCGGGNYCPLSNNTRGQMAVFIVKTFKLQ